MQAEDAAARRAGLPRLPRPRTQPNTAGSLEPGVCRVTGRGAAVMRDSASEQLGEKEGLQALQGCPGPHPPLLLPHLSPK